MCGTYFFLSFEKDFQIYPVGFYKERKMFLFVLVLSFIVCDDGVIGVRFLIGIVIYQVNGIINFLHGPKEYVAFCKTLLIAWSLVA